MNIEDSVWEAIDENEEMIDNYLYEIELIRIKLAGELVCKAMLKNPEANVTAVRRMIEEYLAEEL